MSEEDIPKGGRWSREIAARLEECKVGIICVTPENFGSPWLNFEAGAISKAVDDATYVCPLLLGIEPAQFDGPITEFQMTRTEKEDVGRLIRTVNSALARYGKQGLDDAHFERAFEMWWPELDKAIGKIPVTSATTAPQRSDREFLEEILTRVRELSRENRTRAEGAIEAAAMRQAQLEAFTALGRVEGGQAVPNPLNRLYRLALEDARRALEESDEIKGALSSAMAEALRSSKKASVEPGGKRGEDKEKSEGEKDRKKRK